MKQKQQQTPGPQPEATPKGKGAALRNACVGLTGYAFQACMAAPQQVPPERPAPPPQACPAGAVETMTQLGLRIGEVKSTDWSKVRGRSVRVYEDTPLRVAGDWETNRDPVSYRGDKVALPTNTWLSGRLYVKQGRVYGRFTQARTPLGVTYPVCMELLDAESDDSVGVPLQPGSAPGKMMVDPVVQVRVVDRFK